MNELVNEKLNRFIDLLKGIFELDKSDLDFGIYRIMNIRKNEIEKFLNEDLPKKVEETLAPFASKGKEDLLAKKAEIERQASNLGIEISASPKLAEEYASVNRELQSGTDLSALETDVYSNLFSFFNRYYDDGDFISKRRYKEGVYAIPYEGEEVKLYWANQDQYYIKTSENFKDYVFTADGWTVHFNLVDATTEQNNNKETDDSKRVFMLFNEDEENYPGVKTFECDTEKKELIVRFVFDIPADKKKKYEEENYTRICDYIVKEHKELMNVLLSNVSADKKNPLTLIQKHLKGYIAKNTFDYFIHKDLGGFLSRELDFFIKNEVMHLDDLDTSNEARVETYLAKVKAIKKVGKILIDFLAQIENFQKKLWLKKKFVIETNWCITLDKIDESFYEEIRNNKEQIQEWIDMYAIDEIVNDMEHQEPWANPPSIEFLKQNQNLLIDTKNFSDAFKEKLIATIDCLEKETNGLLLNSDNYQATALIKKLYESRIRSLYLDPPYNTNEASFIYKNNYKHSSWASMISDRIRNAWGMLEEEAVLFITIDDEELYDLKELVDDVVGSQHYIGTIVIQSNPRGRGINSFYATCHEYCLCYAKNTDYTEIIDQSLTEEQERAYSGGGDEEIAYRPLPFRRSGGWSTPQDRPNSEFSLYFNDEGFLFAVGDERVQDAPAEYMTNNILMLDDNLQVVRMSVASFNESYPNAVRIMPVDTSGMRRVWRWSDRKKILLAGRRGDFILKNDKGHQYVQLKDRIKGGRKPKTMWIDSKYDSSSHGTNLLKSFFGARNLFGFPKSVYSTEDTLHSVVGDEGSDGIVLDLFGGSGTTAHAVLNLNRNPESSGNRKYILTEMGEYFGAVTKPRIIKVVYSTSWKDGKPLNRNTGISQIIKYMKIESYEDALSNICLEKPETSLNSLFGDEYLINYMLDIESKGSLLNLDAFKSPFEYKMKITEKNESKLRKVDVVETFNYLIGLTVVRQGATKYYSVAKSKSPEYEGAVDLTSDANGKFAFRQIEGTLPDGRRALIIWRNIGDNVLENNAALDAYFSKYRINPQDREYDVIYVNGDNNLENLKTESESWKVQLIETEFNNRMFEEN